MPARYLSATLRYLRPRRRWGWALVFCWLFLNAQLALANHPCDLDVSDAIPATQHQQHMRQSTEMSHAAHGGTVTPASVAQPEPLCEKHCVPDGIKQDNAAPALIALPVSGDLLLHEQPVSMGYANDRWFTPPVAGPPAEIRFCRFRE